MGVVYLKKDVFKMETQLGISLVLIGLWGIVLNRQNLLMMLVSLELLLLGVNLTLIYVSLILDEVSGQILSLLVLTVAAAESSLGLALLVAFYRLRGSLLFSHLMKG
jgi:NADH-quinone oxidoreductase subunit K